MNIGIDIDGVLLDCEKFQLQQGKKYLKLPIKNKNGYDISDIFEVTQLIDNQFWHDNIYYYAMNMPYKHGAKEIIYKLHSEGHRIIIITNRCSDLSYCDDIYPLEVMKKIVLDSLKLHEIYYDEVIFTDNKQEICQSYAIDIMIEDSIHNLKSLSNNISNRMIICFHAGYNKDFHAIDCVRAYDWENIYTYVHLKELYNILKLLKEINSYEPVNISNELIAERLFTILSHSITSINLLYDINAFDNFTNEYNKLFEEDICRWLGFVKPESITEYLIMFENKMKFELEERTINWVLQKKCSDCIVGVFYLYENNPKWKKANYAIGIRRKYRKLGNAKQIMSAMISYLTNTMHYVKINAEIEIDNIVSLKLMQEKLIELGFEKEGLLKNNYGKGITCELWSFNV